MRYEQCTWSNDAGWSAPAGSRIGVSADMVLVFGHSSCFAGGTRYGELRKRYPKAIIAGCSAAVTVGADDASDAMLVATAIEFLDATVQLAVAEIDRPEQSHEIGIELGSQFDNSGLVHMLVLADGLAVDGDALVAGLREELPAEVRISGNSGSDGEYLNGVLVVANAPASARKVAAIGFFGERIRIGTATTCQIGEASLAEWLSAVAEVAGHAKEALGGDAPQLALLMGGGYRESLLERARPEVKGVRAVLGETAALCGFYACDELRTARLILMHEH